MKLTTEQQRVLVSIVEGAGTTQRFGRWARTTYDALKRRGLITTTKLDAPADCYALWRVDLTPRGRTERAALIGTVEPFPFPSYPRRSAGDTCWHDPRYPVGEWRCPLKRGHADLHRYVPVGLIDLERSG
ncbi:hypothetical protein M9978_17445 [Sphingomonas sp. MG17]|uniref:Uncharacterized protein n=1 Tax=Sphingomonas tagetis TaxID=2949092 RepID=A0A9X2KQW1_9SPHN|nr:hypothetical protein [Sphingomonas tagetis]MCP3732208.1 hypothetical protein [Sphingomonas tagetis]